MIDNSTSSYQVSDSLTEFLYSEILNLQDIQTLQDLFSEASGVASIITLPDGTPITNPSNYCRLCEKIIRKTAKGIENCRKSNALLGKPESDGPVIQPCLNCGLWNACAIIKVGDKHLANWLIGQVRNEKIDEQLALSYADELGVNRIEFEDALKEVPYMSVEQLNKVAKMLFGFAHELSEKANNNFQKKIQIAELQKTTKALLESEEKYRTLFEKSYDAIFLVDIHTGKYLDANKAGEILSGKPLQELRKLTTREITPKGAISRLEKISEEADPVRLGEVEYTREDGSKRIALLNTIPLSNGEVFGIAHDITERIEIEKELVASKEKAEESDRLKTAFLANMSHEIRTPMNGILGFADLLKEKNLSEEEHLRYINIIEKSGVRMLNIINDLIDISKVESGQMEIAISETDINEQIHYIHTFFKPEVEQKGMQIKFRTGLSSNEAVINTDREKVYAILINLVKNAIKYSDKGVIEFGYDLKEAEIDGETAMLHYFVKDTGFGIPREKLNTIFERFVQIDTSNHRTVQGAGLGLSISKAYVEMLGGRIHVESQYGKGSTFYFTLPYK